MRLRPPTARCRTCERVWSGPDLRYCGACGAPLPDAEQAETGASTRRFRRIAPISVAVVVLAGLVVGVTGDRPTVTVGDPRVDLPDDETAVDDSPLTDEEAEALLQQVDPGRLRCEPRGCERWRRDRGALSGVVSVADLVVILEGPRLVALDRETHEVRWDAPVGHLRSVTADGQQVRSTSSYAQLHALSTDDGVLLVTGTEVSRLDLDGERTWSFSPDQDTRWRSVALSHTLVLFGEQRGGRAVRIEAIDPDTGELRWGGFSESVQVIDEDLIALTVPDRSLRAIDPQTGARLWERALRMGQHAERLGPWIAHHREGGLALLDADTGRTAGALPGYPTQPIVDAGDRWLALIAANREGWTTEHPSPWELIALDADGDTLWRTAIPGVVGLGECCPLLLADDGQTLDVVGLTRALSIDVDSGAIVDEVALTDLFDDPDALDPEALGPGPLHRTEDGTLLRWRDPGHLIITRADGDRADVRGREVWVESVDPLIVGSPEHVMRIRPSPPSGPAAGGG